MLSHCLFSLFKNSYAGNFCTGLKPTWSDGGSYSAGFPGQCEAAMRDAWNCCSGAEVREGALVNNKGSFNIKGVSSLTEMSELGDQLLTSQ